MTERINMVESDWASWLGARCGEAFGWGTIFILIVWVAKYFGIASVTVTFN